MGALVIYKHLARLEGKGLFFLLNKNIEGYSLIYL